MPKKLTGMNKYQKKVHRRREDRLRGDGVEFYLSLAYSDNAHLILSRQPKR